MSVQSSKLPKTTGETENTPGVSATAGPNTDASEITISLTTTQPDMLLVPPPNSDATTKPSLSSRLPEAGPALGDLFADSERPRRTKVGASEPMEKTQINGTRPSVPHLQLPSSVAIVNGPATPGHATPISSPSVALATKVPKKMSLDAYRKRIHKSVDPDKKEDDAKIVMEPILTPTPTPLTASATKQLPFLSVDPPLPTPPPSSTMDSNMLAKPWGVR